MADYKAKTTTVAQWQRCFRIVCENARSQTPRIDFLEEVVTVTDGIEVRESVPGCLMDLVPAGLIPVLDPTTGDPTGATATQAEIYTLLYSAYRYAADQRDAAQAPT